MPAHATDTWIDGSDNWSVAGDWSAGVPGNGTDASITDSDGVSRTITYDYMGASVALNSLTIDLNGGGQSAANTLLMPANDLTVTANENIGVTGSAAVTQTGGVNTIDGSAILGDNPGSTGTYNLSGSGEITGNGNLYVGGGTAGTGIFNQSGGTVSLVNTNIGVTLVLGELNGSGAYNLSAGSLESFSEDIGNRGTGNFVQTGGTNSITTTNNQYVALDVGANGAGTTGTYTLSGNATLSSINETIQETGAFIQNGGTNAFSGPSNLETELFTAYAVPGTSSGAYTLNEGTLNFDLFEDEGKFTQTGGQSTFAQVDAGLPGSLTLMGGTMTLLASGPNAPESAIDDLTVGGTGVLNLQLGGSTQGVDYDWIRGPVGGGTISLGGTLDLDVVNGFVPSIGQQFTIMTQGTGSIAGAFSQLTSDDPGLTYTVSYPADNSVVVTITSVPEPAAIAMLVGTTGIFLLRRRKRAIL